MSLGLGPEHVKRLHDELVRLLELAEKGGIRASRVMRGRVVRSTQVEPRRWVEHRAVLTLEVWGVFCRSFTGVRPGVGRSLKAPRIELERTRNHVGREQKSLSPDATDTVPGIFPVAEKGAAKPRAMVRAMQMLYLADSASEAGGYFVVARPQVIRQDVTVTKQELTDFGRNNT